MRSKAETLRVYARVIEPLLTWPNEPAAQAALLSVLAAVYGDGYDAGHKAGVEAADTNISFDELRSDDEISKD